MSYNIDSIKILKDDGAWISASDLERLATKLNDELPECCFLTDLTHCLIPAPENKYRFKTDWIGHWSGCGSGYTWRDLFPKVAKHIHGGEMHWLVTWEGGDSIEGIFIRDGKIIECDVQYTLTPKTPVRSRSKSERRKPYA